LMDVSGRHLTLVQRFGGVRTILLEVRRQQAITKHEQARLGLLQVRVVAGGGDTVRRVVHCAACDHLPTARRLH